MATAHRIMLAARRSECRWNQPPKLFNLSVDGFVLERHAHWICQPIAIGKTPDLKSFISIWISASRVIKNICRWFWPSCFRHRRKRFQRRGGTRAKMRSDLIETRVIALHYLEDRKIVTRRDEVVFLVYAENSSRRWKDFKLKTA
jgi:hypothetical protein